MNYKALVLLLPLLSACNVQTKDVANGDENVTINADEGGHIAFNLPFVQGQVKVPTSVMHNGSFDIDGVRLMPGASITGFSVDAADAGATVNLAFNAPGSPDATRSYFIDQFKAKGVKASIAGNSVSGTSKDGSPFTIDVQPAPNGSKGTVVIHSSH